MQNVQALQSSPNGKAAPEGPELAQSPFVRKCIALTRQRLFKS